MSPRYTRSCSGNTRASAASTVSPPIPLSNTPIRTVTSLHVGPAYPETAPIDGEVQGVCAKLKWTDLPYPGAKAETPPTQINYDSTFDQSCRWTTKIENVEVGVSLRFREGRQITIERTTGDWDVKGHKVSYLDRSSEEGVEPTCVLVVPYDGGGLGIIVIDSSGKFGTVCDQGRKVAEVLIDRETS